MFDINSQKYKIIYNLIILKIHNTKLKLYDICETIFYVSIIKDTFLYFNHQF